MNKLLKCLITLGLFLFFTVLIPFPIAGNVAVANAADIEQEQNEIKLNVKSKSLVKESTYALKLYNTNDTHKVTYKTNDSSIATVGEDGLITAVDFGSATITATVKVGFKTVATLQCEVTVGPPAISVKLTKTAITLSIGRKTSLSAILKPNNTVEEAMFSSNDPTIATVSVGGRITAKSVGVTYIFASIANGKYDMCKITVVDNNTNGESNQSDSTSEE